MMTPEPALWNWRSRGLESGGASKNRRKNGSSSKGLRCPGCSLMVPRVAILTTAGDTRLTMGAREGTGAASVRGLGNAAWAGWKIIAARAVRAAVSAAAANLERRFISVLPFEALDVKTGPDEGSSGPDIVKVVPRSYTQDRLRTLSGGFDGDPMRLHLRHLRNCDFQHTIDEFRLDVLGVGRIRQAETALKLSRDALDAAIALTGFALRLLALTTDGEHALIGGDLHRFGVDAGQIHVQRKLVRFLVDVHGRQPSPRIRGGRQRRAEQAIDILLEPVDECPRLITYDGHY